MYTFLGLYLVIVLVDVITITYIAYIESAIRGDWLLVLMLSLVPIVNIYVMIISWLILLKHFSFLEKLYVWLDKPLFNKEKNK